MLGLISVSFIFTATAPDRSWARGTLLLIESATLVLALWRSRSEPLRLPIGVGLVVTAVVATTQLAASSRSSSTSTGLLSGVLVILTIVVIARGVVGERNVNPQSVIGAICIYLQLGMLFVFLYGVVAAVQSAPFFVQGTDGTSALRLYFSFASLTTVGYGDYTAASNLGHVLAVSEALTGQLYLVTVVAILVSRMRPRAGPVA